MPTRKSAYIDVDRFRTLHGAMEERIRQSGEKTAYRYCDSNDQWCSLSWNEVSDRITHWCRALRTENLPQGARVGVMLRNCPEWIFFEHAALRLGLVVVPLYPNDRPDNLCHIINQTSLELILIEHREPWVQLAEAAPDCEKRPKILSLQAFADDERLPVTPVADWLAQATDDALPAAPEDGDALATIIYTSGTTGLPKGVMLSHRNILFDAHAGASLFTLGESDTFLSFLPLSHALERTAGIYIPLVSGACVAFCRSIPQLADDLVYIKPTVIISVPRIYERVFGRLQTQLEEKPPLARKLFEKAVEVGWQAFQHGQGRAPWSPSLLLHPLLQKLVGDKVLAKLGGRLRVAISGGAPLSEPIAKVFIGLGVPLYQGYGLTETSPVLSVNTPEDNRPASVGRALPGIRLRLGEQDELQAKGPCVMLGYWQNDQATRESFTPDGWLKSGDIARFDGDHAHITGRLKEILVLSNGEKVPPVDVEMAITLHPLFEQAMVLGEGKPYLAAILVLEPHAWLHQCEQWQVDPEDPATLTNLDVLRACKEIIDETMHGFPGYAHVRRITLSREAWTDQNGFLTAALKLRRPKVHAAFAKQINHMYHDQ